MKDFFLNIVSNIGVNDILDILIMTFIVYKILGFVTKTRSAALIKGLVIFLIAFFVATLFDFYTVSWLFRGIFTFGVFALIVVFQPELRRGLEYIGRNTFGLRRFSSLDSSRAKHITDEIVKAVDHFSQTKTGALIVFERQITLEEIAETGTVMDADISSQALGNIFYEGAPLHDGAVLIRGDRIHAAGCVLPLTANKNLNKDLGTRHRAGIGITESSDAIVIIVSEETGIISLAEEGRIRRFLDGKGIEKTLLDMYVEGEDESDSFSFKKILEWIGIRRGKDAK